VTARSKSLLVAAGVAAALLIGIGLARGGAREPPPRVGGKPNIVVIYVDDQALNTFDSGVMPETFARLVRNGTRFANGLAVPPLCCPDRAGFLTGSYPHNHGALNNDYALLRQKRNVLPAWLKRLGYRTGLVGEWLNRVEGVLGETGRPPGWDTYFQIHAKYYDYTANDDGVLRRFGHEPDDYSTTVLTERARDFILEAEDDARPFFLWLTHAAPHDSKTPAFRDHPCHWEAPMAPRNGDWERVRHDRLPEPPNFDERNVRDKVAPKIRETPPLDAPDVKRFRQQLNCTKAAMRQVDRGVAAIDQALTLMGQSDSTIVVYTSDNGFFHGQHRLENKALPYEESWRVPLVIRAPERVIGADAPAVIPEQASNIDLAPTFLDLVGAQPCAAAKRCRKVDGRSLLPLLRGERPRALRHRAVLAELGTSVRDTRCSGYESVRTMRWSFIRYWVRTESGRCRLVGEELYDRVTDPYQVRNLLWRPSRRAIARSDRLATRLRELEVCSGRVGAHACE
jgi:arylsulfatase A-like enzyme